MNLLEQHGAATYNSRIAGAFIRHSEGWVGILGQCEDGTNIKVTKVEGKIGKLSTEDVYLRPDFLPNLAALGTPDLGYRTAAEGRLLVYITNAGGYNRGIGNANANMTYSNMSYDMFEARALSSSYYSRPDVRAMLVHNPEYLDFHTGAAAMSTGDLASFAINSYVALSSTANPLEAALEVRGQVVGRVALDTLEIKCNITNIRQVLGVAA